MRDAISQSQTANIPNSDPLDKKPLAITSGPVLKCFYSVSGFLFRPDRAGNSIHRQAIQACSERLKVV